MTSAEVIPAVVLKRKAVVYVRQSTQSQVMTNLESKRRQYDLVDVARQRGFVDVEIIDDDLGRSASGTVARPGFDRLVAWLCAGKVGAVVCFDASRLARNGRDWHHLLELCGLVEARVIDLDGVYNPCRPNDRLLLGMKGSISEFELGVLRARMLDAARSKARRGELRLSVPFGYIWHREAGLGLDPDLRLQEVIRLIFTRFRELGSARQVLLSMKADRIHFPRPSDEGRMTSFDWVAIRYRNVIAVLKNPFYAGVYVYGKSEKRTSIIEGRARRSYGHGKPIGTWEVMIKDHHEGYIDWAASARASMLAMAPSLRVTPNTSSISFTSRSKPMAWVMCRCRTRAAMPGPKGEPGSMPSGAGAWKARAQQGQVPRWRWMRVTTGRIGGRSMWS
jgi:DNA invertase Pin-like site-specific DNA recombinase